MTEQSDEFELYLSEVENVNSLEELKLQLDRNEIDYGERYIGSHALYYKIWTQSTLIDALEQALADNKDLLDLANNRYKVLDKATLKQIEEINALNKKIESLKINEDIYKHIDNTHGYLIAINNRIKANVDNDFSSAPSKKYFANTINELEAINKLKNT